MSFIDNIKSEIDEASARYDLMNDKIMLFESVAYNNAIIKQKEAYLDAYKYGGEVEDYFTESDDDRFVDKVKATINKIIENLKEFFEKCKEKVIEIFEKIRESALVTKLNNLIKQNPEVGKAKVEFEDNRGLMKFVKKEADDSKKQLARIKSGRITEKDKDEIENRDNRVALKIAAGATLVTITVAALLLLLPEFKTVGQHEFTVDQTYGGIDKAIKEINVDHYSKAVSIKTGDDGWRHPVYDDNVAKLKAGDLLQGGKLAVKKVEKGQTENSNILVLGYSHAAKMDHIKAKLHINQLQSIITSLRSIPGTIQSSAGGIANKVKGKDQVPAPKVESASYEDSFDTDDYFSELCNDIFGEDTSTKDDFDKMCSELCNDIFF